MVALRKFVQSKQAMLKPSRAFQAAAGVFPEWERASPRTWIASQKAFHTTRASVMHAHALTMAICVNGGALIN